MKAQDTLVIVNPYSGTQKKGDILKQIERELTAQDINYDIVFTKGPTHATDLAKEASEAGRDLVLAVGGDGTVNETATGLLKTNTSMGIIPIGSGNGLGRHFGISSNPTVAIRSMLTGGTIGMDVCTANGIPLFNVGGLGYDAAVAHDFALQQTRGFSTYIRIVLSQWFKYRSRKFKIATDELNIKKRAFLISLANGSQFGNNAFIAPNASVDDGLMDVCILEKFPGTAVPFVAFQLFNKMIEQSKYSEIFQTSEITIKQKGKKVHLDGEPYKLGKKITFKVIPGALNILAPKAFLDEQYTQYSFS